MEGAMYFRMSLGERSMVCGVEEFSAAEGTCVVPAALAKEIGLEHGRVVSLELVRLEPCTRMAIFVEDRGLLECEDLLQVIEA